MIAKNAKPHATVGLLEKGACRPGHAVRPVPAGWRSSTGPASDRAAANPRTGPAGHGLLSCSYQVWIFFPALW